MPKPAIELTLEGEGLKALQRKIRALEDGKLMQRELNRALREGSRPLIDEARSAARADLPHAGGLADRIANAPMRIQVSSGRDPGVKIRVSGVDARSADRGRLRHPVYGNRENWVTQDIRPGWFTDRMRARAPMVRDDLVGAMERVAQKIARA